jgi:hypothetical protein
MACDLRSCTPVVPADARRGPGVFGSCGSGADQGDYDHGLASVPPCAGAGGARSSTTGDGSGLPFPVGRFCPGRAWRSGPLVCIGGL